MAKKKHHFVPKFYLTHFESAPRRINLLNLDKGFPVRDAGLADQCYKHKFHGETDTIEDGLAKLESYIAPVVARVIESAQLPPHRSNDYIWMYVFVALQFVRTSRRSERTNTSIDLMAKGVLQHVPQLQGIDLNTVKVGFDNPVLFSLKMLPEILESIWDLKPCLLRAQNNQYVITSDNPVFLYNQYYEWFSGLSMLGTTCRGLQMFLPLSPSLVLMLYDADVYEINSGTRGGFCGLSYGDMVDLIQMQVIGAESNVYFHEWKRLSKIEQIAKSAAKYRRQNEIKQFEYERVSHEKIHKLVHVSDIMPNLRLRLSFCAIQKDYARMPRGTMLEPRFRYRKESPPFPEYL